MTGGTTAALVAGTAMSAVGAIQAGQAQKSASNFNAAVARNNAIAAQQTATENARRQERAGRKRQGELRANVSTFSGSALDLIEDSAMEEELQRLSIIHGGDVQAAGFNNTATLETMQGKAAANAGFMKAGSTLLLGASKFGGGSGGSSYANKPMSYGGSQTYFSGGNGSGQ